MSPMRAGKATAGRALRRGGSIAQFNPKRAEEGRPNMTIVIAASDAFFERLQNHVRAQRLYQAAIDRDHSFARTFFENLTALAASDSLLRSMTAGPLEN